MKKFLVLLAMFCLALCMVFTACAKIPAQNTSQDTEGAQLESEDQSTKESTTVKKPYTVCYTSIRETKALRTEIPELQEKIDRNCAAEEYPHVQQKVIVQFGDQRDVPYNFQWGGWYVEEDHITYYPCFPTAYALEDFQSKEEYMPTYTYTGTESFSIELNDELYHIDEYWCFEVISYDGSIEKTCWSFEEMYMDLPKGKYYVYFDLIIYGNEIIPENGGTKSRENKTVHATFILDLQ